MKWKWKCYSFRRSWRSGGRDGTVRGKWDCWWQAAMRCAWESDSDSESACFQCRVRCRSTSVSARLEHWSFVTRSRVAVRQVSSRLRPGTAGNAAREQAEVNRGTDVTAERCQMSMSTSESQNRSQAVRQSGSQAIRQSDSQTVRQSGSQAGVKHPPRDLKSLETLREQAELRR
jgi:hypothetical protein